MVEFFILMILIVNRINFNIINYLITYFNHYYQTNDILDKKRNGRESNGPDPIKHL